MPPAGAGASRGPWLKYTLLPVPCRLHGSCKSRAASVVSGEFQRNCNQGGFNGRRSTRSRCSAGTATGPEVVRARRQGAQGGGGRRGLQARAGRLRLGGDRYLRTGEVLPPDAVAEMKKHDAIFLGAIGHPDVKPGIAREADHTCSSCASAARPRTSTCARDQALPRGQTPLKDKGPADIDYVVVRENSRGRLPPGSGGR